MAIDVVCPRCGAEYRLKNRKRGRRMSCRQCGAAITPDSEAAGVLTPATRNSPYTTPTHQRSGDQPTSAFQDVQQGIGYAYMSVITVFLSETGLQAVARMKQNGVLTGPLILFPVLFLVVGNLLGIAGRLRCLRVPPECHARNFIVMTVATELSGVLLLLAGWWTGRSGLTILGGLSLMVSSVCFLLFLRRVSQGIGDDTSVRRVSLIFFCCVGTFPVLLLAALLQPLGLWHIVLLPPIMLLVGGIAYLMLLRRLTHTLKSVRFTPQRA